MKIIWPVLILTLCLGLTACGDRAENRAQQARFYAFGTEIDVSLFGVDRQTAQQTIAVLEASFDQTNSLWHAWQPSILTDINAAIRAGETIAVDDDVAAVVLQARQLAEASDHLFNPAAGDLFALWGFEQSDWYVSRPPPSQAEIDAWLAHAPTLSAIHIEDGKLHSDNPHVRIGFGGFAKGYAVDKAIEALQQLGIDNAVVNIGGDLRAIGQHGKRPWVIGVQHPRHDAVMASIAVSTDESVFSSGDYERFFIHDGQRYAHILDPRTGHPADYAMSVTVIDDNASKADAAATALFVAGENWPEIAARLGIDKVMVMTRDSELQLSPAMEQRARIVGHSAPAVIRPVPILDQHD